MSLTGHAPRGRATKAAIRLAGLKIDLVDFTIALGRKVGGFCALLLLGWLYFRLLVLGQSPHQIYPDAADPDLRQTLWVALFLIMAQGWDIPTDQIIEHWTRARARWPRRSSAPPEGRTGSRPTSRPRGRRTLPHAAVRAAELVVARLELVAAWLERLMDLCVAIANKVGALAALVYLIVLAERTLSGVTARAMYPPAADPVTSLLADICVYVVVLGWWATPFEQIATYWRRLRGKRADDRRTRRQDGCGVNPNPQATVPVMSPHAEREA